MRKPMPRLRPFVDGTTGFALDLTGLDVDPHVLAGLLSRPATSRLSPLASAHREMQRLEAGAIKNPDEKRQVTHFSDRLSYPDSKPFRDVEALARKARAGRTRAGRVETVIVNGIGGSALGPQLLQFALNGPYWNELPAAARRGYPRLLFLDNTDPAGLADLKAVADPARSLVVTISKSGGTQETRNNMLALEAWYAEHKVCFADHAVAVTKPGSKLDTYAAERNWLDRLPMAESIGGRTSETNIVGHVPAALTGVDFGRFVAGARHMDDLTRRPRFHDNPAYQLAAAWYAVGHGRGDRNMVVVPYSDRLVLLSKYLQQLVMESLGKALDLDGRPVNQGLTVFGNKGGTDAHAYIQQLNDGRDDFFVTFIEVLKDAEALPVEGGLTMGDYLHAFKCGLTAALRRGGRKVALIEIETVDAFNLGMLIALYERAVAVYAEFVHINAFHQPGVEAYKQASGEISKVHAALTAWLAGSCPKGWSGTAAELAAAAGLARQKTDVAGWLAKFAVNGRRLGKRTLSRRFADGAWQYRVG